MSAQIGREQLSQDEQAIRQLVDTWLAASKRNDLETIDKLMADDVVFMVPGREPFGKEEFMAQSETPSSLIDATSNILELKVLGNWAWMRHHLEVSIGQPGGPTTELSGYILTILQKNTNGQWVISRDANFLMPKQ